jgi:circadian clock protein KaiC
MDQAAAPDVTFQPGHLPKAPTGVSGFDAITLGGLPARRPTLLCGGPGCGKTLFAMTFLVKGATEFNQPGVFLSFEETSEDLADNVASLGYNLPALIAENKLAMDYVRIERSEIEETGEYDLEGLFIRLGHAIKTVGAKRVVLDTLEALFVGLRNTAILRAELRRLFGWLKEQGVTAVITAERGDGTLTRYGLEEYVSDCVILLDHRIQNQITTRRLRIVKYRGSGHGTNEYPFLIDDQGISVLPITSVGLKHGVSDDRVPTGIADLDAMLGAGGFYRGSSVLLSGVAGTGKTSLVCHFVEAACQRGERCLYFAFEESPHQIVRNMRSIGIDLAPWVQKGLLRFEAARPSLYGLEMHLARMNRDIESFAPAAVILDPISSLRGDPDDVHATLLRMVDMLKSRGITAILTNLISAGEPIDHMDQNVSSLMDTWLSLMHLETNGERNRGLYVLKSRGMNHSNQIREYLLTDHGVRLVNVYLGSSGVLTGSARLAQEAEEKATAIRRLEEIERKQRETVRKREALERQIGEMRAAMEAEETEVRKIVEQERARDRSLQADRDAMATSRRAAE